VEGSAFARQLKVFLLDGINEEEAGPRADDPDELIESMQSSPTGSR
jgi:hypothetical protein